MKQILAWTSALLLMAAQGMAANNCLTFDGVDDWVSTPDTAVVIPTNGTFTVECWALSSGATTNNGYREIISQGSSGNAFYLGFGPDGQIRVGEGWVASGVSYPSEVNEWHHFAVVAATTQTLLYVDGMETASATNCPNPAVVTSFRLGRQYGGYSEYWQGSIDDVRIWEGIRSPNEIKDNMVRLSQTNSAASTLRVRYTCEDTGATDLTDTISGMNGTLVNGISRESMSTIELDQTDCTVDWTTQTFSVSGSTDISETAVSWTNTANGASGSGSISNQSFQIEAIPLEYGSNLIRVDGEQTAGLIDSDQIWIMREAAPVALLDITSTNATVLGEQETITITGTNNSWIVGSLSWTNSANAENGSFAVSNFTFHVSSIPLAFGVNTISVSGTNELGVVASDAVIITRSMLDTGNSPTHYVSTLGSHTWPYYIVINLLSGKVF